MPNQHKPLPPLEDIAPHIIRYWKMRKTDIEILELLRTKHIDLEKYGIRRNSYRRIRKDMGLCRAREQAHTIESIRDNMIALRKKYPKAGVREILSILFHEKGVAASKSLIIQYCKQFEPDLVRERKAGRLKRRRLWSAGVNDLWAVDQHNKWKKFGLALHTGIDPFPGKILWMKVWWTNNNPKLIASYYLNTVEANGYMPLVSQSDLGSENYGLANAQTVLRHCYDPNLVGTIQHRWMRHKKNVMPEIAWSQLHRRFTPRFEDILQQGITNDWYNIANPLDVLVFRWIFIPWVQQELDSYVLPHGVPNNICKSPDSYGCLDFKVTVEKNAVDYARSLYAPITNAVFELVPSTFEKFANILYTSMGNPVVTGETVWQIYNKLRFRFGRLDEAIEYISEWEKNITDTIDSRDSVELIARKDLGGGMNAIDEYGQYYMGGLNNGQGLDDSHIARMEELNDDLDLQAYFSEEELADNETMDEW